MTTPPKQRIEEIRKTIAKNREDWMDDGISSDEAEFLLARIEALEAALEKILAGTPTRKDGTYDPINQASYEEARMLIAHADEPSRGDAE